MKFLVENRPTITAMVQAKTTERTVELIKKGIAGGADAFGIQLETLERRYHSKEILSEIIAAGEGRPFYITNYRYGVNSGMTDEELADEILDLADLDNVLLDVMGDLFEPSKYQITYDEIAVEKQKELIGKIKAKGAQVLMSSHTECFMTSEEALKIAVAQQSRGIDIAKVVIKSDSEAEQQSCFATSALMAEKMEVPTLFLCAGAVIHRHRRTAPFVSNNCMFLCVVEHDDLATPAQPLLADIKKLVDLTEV